MKVTLFSITEKHQIATKIFKICEKMVEKEIFLQISCPDTRGVEFLDKMLWDLSPSAFLPHAKESAYKNEPILITTNKKFICEKFTHIIWLYKDFPLDLDWTHLYDFDDVTSKESKEVSQKKYLFYKEKNCNISLV
jgi:DNA polymerase IIIc chi subunit